MLDASLASDMRDDVRRNPRFVRGWPSDMRLPADLIPRFLVRGRSRRRTGDFILLPDRIALSAIGLEVRVAEMPAFLSRSISRNA